MGERSSGGCISGCVNTIARTAKTMTVFEFIMQYNVRQNRGDSQYKGYKRGIVHYKVVFTIIYRYFNFFFCREFDFYI